MKLLLPVFVFCLVSSVSSCKKEKAEEEQNDNELITTVQVKVTEQGGGLDSTYSWRDLDGAGGANPTIDQIKLAPNKVYNVQLVVLDESQSPAKDVTSEIDAESDVPRAGA